MVAAGGRRRHPAAATRDERRLPLLL